MPLKRPYICNKQDKQKFPLSSHHVLKSHLACQEAKVSEKSQERLCRSRYKQLCMGGKCEYLNETTKLGQTEDLFVCEFSAVSVSLFCF